MGPWKRRRRKKGLGLVASSLVVATSASMTDHTDLLRAPRRHQEDEEPPAATVAGGSAATSQPKAIPGSNDRQQHSDGVGDAEAGKQQHSPDSEVGGQGTGSYSPKGKKNSKM